MKVNTGAPWQVHMKPSVEPRLTKTVDGCEQRVSTDQYLLLFGHWTSSLKAMLQELGLKGVLYIVRERLSGSAPNLSLVRQLRMEPWG